MSLLYKYKTDTAPHKTVRLKTENSVYGGSINMNRLLKIKKIFFLYVIFVICIAAAGCGGSGKSSSKTDTTAPDEVTLTAATITDTSISFTWTNPSDTDFNHVKMTWTKDGVDAGSSETTDKTITTYSISGLTASSEYSVTVKAADSSGNETASIVTVSTLSSGSKDYSFIYTTAELYAVNSALSGNYILMADLDLSSYNTGTGWTPIGNNTTYFTGVFEGNNHVIKNLYINDSSNSYKGLFGYTSGAKISNLGLDSVNVSGGNFTGGLVGVNESSAITDCYATGTVTGSWIIGGLAGYNNSSTITDCYTTGTVKGSSDNTGGLVGWNKSSTITDCYATGAVTGSGWYTGGLVGDSNYSSTITDCYATGVVTGNVCTGGLVGVNDSSTITDCYATGAVTGSSDTGGLTGYTSGTITSCYYDSTTTGMSDNGYGTPRTTAQMKLQDVDTYINTTIYIGWDFVEETTNGSDDVWSIDTTGTINNGYPYLTNLVP